MLFPLTEEQQAVQSSARDFARTYLAPSATERDETQRFPLEEVKKMGELGFMGMLVSPTYNGGGLDMISYILAVEEIARVDAAIATSMSVNNSLVCWGLEEYGNEQQKEKYLKPLATGQILGAFCLSEPEAGSDAKTLHTSALPHEDHYLLNGVKNWITNGNSASIYLVVAQSDPTKEHKGLNTFIVEKNTPGVRVGKKEDKLGIRSSDTHAIHFQDAKIPTENRLGAAGDGFNFAMRTLNGGRIAIAAQALGIATEAYTLALNYAQQRKTFEKPIFQHQAIQFKLADMATQIEAAKLLTLHAAHLKQQQQPYAKASATAKLFASKVAVQNALEAIQIHGGYGYVREYQVERLLRDAKITEIYEGTSEIQKIVISKEILK